MITLPQIAVFLLAAVIFVPLFRLLKMSSILGYVAAGLAIGPWGLGLIQGVERILQASEFGVVLLLFVIGLELQPSRLWVLRRAVFGAGSAQVVLCSVLMAAAAWGLGLTLTAAAVIGFGLALSSTALVLQVLAERGQLTSHHGRAAFGILLFQDLAVLPMLAALPLMSATATHAGSPLWNLLVLVVTVGLAMAAGRILLRPVLRIIARTKITEVFTAAALLIVIGMALVVNSVGLSMSLGAFLAGVLLADSEFRHELEADIEPFKGLLLGLFFISVGMSANLGLLVRDAGIVAAVTLAFMFVKLGAVALLGRFAGQPKDSPLRLGIALMAGGEFAFVLFSLAAAQGIFDAEVRDVLVLSVTLSMIVGPLAQSLYDAKLHALFLREEARPFDAIEAREMRVLIAGFGRFGQIIGRVLRARRIPFTAMDVSSANIDFIRRFGNDVYYGDASRLDLLRAAGTDKAAALIIAVDDVEASLRIAQLVQQHFPSVKLFARARNRQHAFRLLEIGVQNVIRETYASSLEAASSVLQALGTPAAKTRALIDKFRKHDEATLQRQFAMRDDEVKLIASSHESALQLETLFESDRLNSPASAPSGSSSP